MNCDAATIVRMAKKSSTRKTAAPPAEPEPKKGQNRSPSYELYCRIRLDLGELLVDYIETTEPRPSKTSVVELALVRYFTSLGLWPLKKPKASEPE